MVRRLLLLIVLALGAALVIGAPGTASAAGGVSRGDAIKQLDTTRQSVDETLALLKSGNAQEALTKAKDGYLSHFELVETPLRVADNDLTITTEFQFATIRTAIGDGKPVDVIRDEIITLRNLLDKAERALTDAGVGAPALVAGQSFLILFREGFEIVLLLSVLLGYLEAARSPQFIKPVLMGVGLAAVATVLTVLLMPTIFGLLPIGREVLEAVTALVAVAVLFYVSFWLIARLEHKRWMEFVRARLWSAISVGSTASLMAVGFTAVYREGFETALFYQSLMSFGEGLGWYILLGVALACVALAGVAYVVFKLGRKLPVRTFMNTAVVMVMITSIAFLGNAIYTLQSADVITFRRTSGPRLPIFLAEATGVWPTRPSLLAQGALALIYVFGAVFQFVIKPRLANRPSRRLATASS
ncbi:MAG: iron permease [Ilumatobacteraceae bacterium]|nr:iron permease [Ilumatobacteraceae bacterium]